ncbi:hypothetical protein [Nocardia grenadensis]|uniref:hypothetical protein n=1 Tax=Nocardia grenadensis TaxID=931537 RepID=UPI003D75A443
MPSFDGVTVRHPSRGQLDDEYAMTTDKKVARTNIGPRHLLSNRPCRKCTLGEDRGYYLRR